MKFTINKAAADLPSIQLIKEALNEFKETSGLAINPIKESSLLCCCVLRVWESDFGMPPIPDKLNLKDCQPLIDKMVAKISS